MILLAGSVGPDQTVRDVQTDQGLRCPHMINHTFSHGRPICSFEIIVPVSKFSKIFISSGIIGSIVVYLKM